MESPVEDILEPQTEWVAPELKKVNVEEITAAITGSGGDGLGEDS